MVSSKELKALITLAGKIDPSLQSAMMKASKLSNNVSKQAKESSSSMSKLGNIVKGVFIGNLASSAVEKLGDKLLEAGKDGIKLASDLTEVQNVVDVSFGKNATKINDWASKANNAFGLSELSAKQYTGTLGAMMKSSGIAGDKVVTMSEKLTGLAGDFSSFYNLSQEDAFEKIRSGISGETEPLKQLGINMSVANLQAYALSKGIKTSYEKMDQASQTALRYGYLMHVSKDAQGDFQRTSGSFANQIRLLQTNFEQLSAKVMSNALPALNKVAQTANKFLGSITPDKIAGISKIVTVPFEKLYSIGTKTFNNLTKVVHDNQGTLNNLGKVAKDIGDKLEGAFNSAKPPLKWLFENGVPLVTKGLFDILDGSTKVYDFINKNWNLIIPIVAGITGAIIAYKIATIELNVAEKAGMIIQVLSRAWAEATTIIQLLSEGESIARIAQLALNAAMIENPIGLVCTAIGVLIGVGIILYQNWNSITKAVSGAWNWFQTLIKGMPDVAIALTGPLAPLLLLIKHFKEVQDVVGGAFNAVKNFFGFGGSQNNSTSTPSYSKITSVPKFASGGVASRPSIFGEDGPEMAIPLKRTPRSLSLLNQTAEMLGAASSNNANVKIDIHVDGSSGNSNDITEQIKSAIKEIMDEYFPNDDERRVSFE